MGCGSSKAVATVVPGTDDVYPRTRESIASVKQNEGIRNKTSDNATTIDKNNKYINSNASLNNSLTNVNNATTKPRDISFSASSSRSADSGISEIECERGILTEKSNPDRIIEVCASDRPSTPELCLEGRSCPRLQSGKEKRRLELVKEISGSSVPTLPSVSDDSTLQRPKTRGIAFNVMLCPETGNIKKAPANLPKLEIRKRKKELTKEELDEKMRKATERRKEHERKIVEKSQAFNIPAHLHSNHETSQKDQERDGEVQERENSDQS